MTAERDRCIDLLVTGMLGCVTFHHDIPDDRIEGIRAAMRETADSFLSVWDDSKAHGGRLIVDQTWDRAERVPAAGTELYQWVRGRAARPDESAEGLRDIEEGPSWAGIDLPKRSESPAVGVTVGQYAPDEHARGWAEGARAAVDGHVECSRVGCGKPSRHFYANHSYCDDHEPDPSGAAYRS